MEYETKLAWNIVLAVGSLAFVAGGIGLTIKGLSTRGRALRELADQWDFTYDPNGREAIRAVFGDCPLLQGGRGSAARHLLAGTHGDLDCYLFDWASVTGWDQPGEVRWQTCAGVRLPASRGLPRFDLRPGGNQPKRLRQPGLQTVPLPPESGCVDRYWLQVETPGIIENRITEDLGALLQKAFPLQIECTGDTLLLYHPNEKLAPIHLERHRKRLAIVCSALGA
jgi:hypothetical protein